MVVIIDYGVGNLASVEKACKKIDPNIVVSGDRKNVEQASKLIIPGVGSYGDGMQALTELNLDEIIKDRASKEIPILGICLGMQLLGSSSEESPGVKGLQLIDFDVKRFNESHKVKIPHVGWNSIDIASKNPLFTGVDSGSDVYFVHSYHVDDKSISNIHVAAYTCYQDNFISAVINKNIYGVQFHPEKSQTTGLNIIENFIKYC